MKKGEITVGKVIVLILAVFVIVAAAILISKGNIPDVFPTFNNSQERIEAVGILRYDLSANKVEYYDGTQFIEMKQNLVVNEITLDQKQVTQAFVQKWHFEHETKEIALSNEQYNNPVSGKKIYVESNLLQDQGKIKLRWGYPAPNMGGAPITKYAYLTLANQLEYETTAENLLNTITNSPPDQEYALNVGNLGATFVIPDTNCPQCPDINTRIHIRSINGLPSPFKRNLLQNEDRPVIKINEQYTLYRIKERVYTFSVKDGQNINAPLNLYLVINSPSADTIVGMLYVPNMENSRYLPLTSIGPIEQEIIQKASAWRDAPLQKPLALPIQEKNEQKTIYLCTQKKDTKYIVIDLSKQQTASTLCN